MAKILIVDDSNLSRRMMRRILEPLGHEIIEAGDGMVALERYALEQPDLVMLDLTMQGMHGLDVLAHLRELDAEARVVVASADIQRSTRAMVEERGGHAFLSKPFAADQVLATVRALLGDDDDTEF